MKTDTHLPMHKTSPLRSRGMSFLLAALLAGLVAAPMPGRAADDPKKQSPKPLVTSDARIPIPERNPAAKPIFSGKFSYVTVDKTDHHESVIDVTMYIPWVAGDTTKQVKLQIGKPDSESNGLPEVVTYRVLQIHMHRHGEHTMDGNEYPLEMHCVLTDPIADDEQGNRPPPKAVLAFLIQQGTQNNVGLDFYFEYLDREEGKVELKAPPLATVPPDFNLLLPHDKTYFCYSGSLTSPNLDNTLNTTPIRWYVLRNEIYVSTDQYTKYANAVAEHFRIPQTGNNSTVWLIIPQPLGEL